MTSKDIRKRFLDFFAARGHRVLPSSSLVPAHDPTLLFSNAGMNQFKDVFLGREKRDYSRATTSQKCVRAGGKHNDLEQVGRTTRHHTFFEMLGNFSFGDYFKKEAIPWAWELVTKNYAIPAEKLYVTVFREDDEAAEIWATDVGVPRDRIFRMDEHDNFWAMGDTGPCGPCSEIHYDLGPAASTLGHPDCPFPCPQDCGRYVELWNLVFMQFNHVCDKEGFKDDGSWGCVESHDELLPRPSVDTGAGLERLAAVLQGKISNYDTDLFRPLIEDAAGLANVEYGANHDTDVSLRIIGDHARAATFLISDGVLPSNEGRGYVLRLIMRRALYHGQTLGLNEPFLYKMAGHVVQMMKDAYPELVETEHHVVKAIKIEEERYAHTTRVGLERLESTPIVLRSGEELPLRLARPLQRIIAERPHDEELSSRWQRRAGSWNTTDEERTAFEEFARTWNSRDRFYKLFDAVSALLPAEARKKDWMGHFKMAVGQEASNISLINSYVRAMWRLREREEVASSPLLRDAADLLMRRFPPQGTPAWIPGDELFKLHDTFGLRPDFIEDIVKVYGFAVDRAGYEAEMQKQRERARASWVAIEKKLALPAYLKLSGSHKSEFLGYEETRASGCRVVAILPRGIDQILPEVLPGKGPVELEVVLDKTPFYAEAGGQVGDRGWFTVNGERAARVEDTYSPVTGIIAHRVRWAWPPPQFKLRIGDIISAEVDEDLRRATMRNHTATHLLHAALRKTLGTHVKQAGSLVAPDRLRFDFTHYAALDEQDLRDIEDLVNEHILKNEVVATEEKDRDSAVAGGATALFGEKYADKVRVLSINDFSKELCGGTHVQRTGDIGLFKIVSESSVAAGTRRIEAVTGKAVLEHMRLIMSAFQEQQGRALKKRPRQISLGETARAVLGGSDPLTRRLRELEGKVKKLESQQMKQAADQARQLLGGIKKAPADSAAGSWKDEARQSVGVDIIVRGVRVVVARVEVTDRSAMRQMVDDLRAKLQSGVIVLGSVSEGKVSLVAAVTKDLTNKLDAGKIVKQAAAIVEGSGGGRKDLAEAGGKNPAKLDESLQAVPAIVEAMLSVVS